nr:hypothetical protein HmN_000694900 [Hymenolepis microstoma]
MLICVHGCKEDSSRGVLEAAPELSEGRNLSFTLTYRINSCSVALDGGVYTLGGRNKFGESISRVERINPLNGEVTVLQPMSEARDGHSTVARDYANLVFVYAGSWCEIAPMLNPTKFPEAEFLNGKVCVVGDYKDSTSPIEMLTVFAEGPPQWTQLTNVLFNASSMISFGGSLLFGSESS